MFWNGPSFLLLDASGWPKPKQSSSEAFDNIENVETHVAVSEDVSSNSDIRVENLMKIKNFSSLEKLLLVTSFVLRFKNNSLAKIRKTPYTKGFISTKELKYAEKHWIYSNQRKIITSSKFSQLKKSLGIFYDKENILQVKGRFSNADVNCNVKHPTLLHNESYFTELVVWSAQNRVLHGGVNNTLNFIRNDYWLCKRRKTVRAILNKCVTCKKSHRRPLLGPELSDLPKFRLDFDYAFCNTGVGFPGPLYVKDIYGKNDEMFKSYICLFTCATTRNVHLELTPSMDASDVIKALVRFLSRRGCIKMFVSDNFSSFKSDEVSKFLLLHNIDWKFILPLSPWWGGVYERLVRTVKNTLRKILERSKLNFEELYTILT